MGLLTVSCHYHRLGQDRSSRRCSGDDKGTRCEKLVHALTQHRSAHLACDRDLIPPGKENTACALEDAETRVIQSIDARLDIQVDGVNAKLGETSPILLPHLFRLAAGKCRN